MGASKDDRQDGSSKTSIEKGAADQVTEKSVEQPEPEGDPERPATTTTPKEFLILPVPRRLRYDPEKPHHFGWTLILAFGFAAMITAANLYYCQPILIQLSETFHVDYNAVSRIPTLVQAGYAVGLLLITPLGDLVRRRQLILLLQILSTALTIGLALTASLAVFEALSFLVGVLTVTPQILLPLAADLAPPARRATVISVVLSGLLLGILGARVIAGIIAEYADWRVVYYFAIGVQGAVLLGSWVMLPDYPSKNDDMHYGGILWSMAKFAVTEPVLVQGCLINIANSACFSNFWVTLTFLLAGDPYNYSTLVIGLFGLVGMAGVAFGPFLGYAVDRLSAWHATLAALLVSTVFFAVQVAGAGEHVAAVVIAGFGYDVARQSLAVSLSAAIFALDPAARSRMNALMILSFFIGQVMGTSVGTRVFLRYGWRMGAGLNLIWMGFQIAVLLARGPRCGRYRWAGWEGGLGWREKEREGGAGQEKGESGGDVLGEGKMGTEGRGETLNREKEKMGGA